MSYRICIDRQAQKEFNDLPPDVRGRAKESVLALANDPRPRHSRKLTGREGWRIRVGDYRVIYEIEDSEKTITILHLGHRRNVY